MKKKLCEALCICLFFVGENLFSQSKLKIGLDAGYTYSVLSANLSNLVDSKYTGRYGYGINFSGEYIMYKALFVSSGISFLQKNYSFERTGSHAGWYTNYNNYLLSFPLMVGSYILNNPYENEGIWLKLAGGMYAEYWLIRNWEGQFPLFSGINPDGSFNYTKASGKYDFNTNENQLNRFGYGLQGQVQLGYSFSNKFDLYGTYNYQYGLSDISKTNTDKNQKMATRSYMISIGISYKFD